MQNPSSFRTLFAAGAAALLMAGCGSKAPEITRVCPDFPGTPSGSKGFTFVLTEGVDPRNVPVPTNDSEAILFALAYPGLIEADCEGAPVRHVATSWQGLPEDSSWTFTIGARASFADGSPVKAADIRTMWMDRRRAAAQVDPWIWDNVHEDAVEIAPDGRLLIHAPRAYADLLEVLTQPSLALGKDNVPPWPLGTRGTLVEANDFSQSGFANWVWKRGGGGATGASEISFRVMKDASIEDILAAKPDAFFLRDRNALAAVEQQGGYDITPLPYSRLYLLLTPDAEIAKKLEKADVSQLLELSVGESRAAVHAEGYRLHNESKGGGRRTAKERIVIPWWDRDTLAIGERLSALWREASRAGVPAILPKRRSEFFRHLLEGGDALYVVPVYPLLQSESLERIHLLRSAPWLAEKGGAIPLFETRGHLVTREGLTGFRSGFDGIPHLEGAGWGTPAIP